MRRLGPSDRSLTRRELYVLNRALLTAIDDAESDDALVRELSGRSGFGVWPSGT